MCSSAMPEPHCLSNFDRQESHLQLCLSTHRELDLLQQEELSYMTHGL